jgi:hypothetical protein
MRDHIDDRIADADDIDRGGIHRHGSRTWQRKAAEYRENACRHKPRLAQALFRKKRASLKTPLPFENTAR